MNFFIQTDIKFMRNENRIIDICVKNIYVIFVFLDMKHLLVIKIGSCLCFQEFLRFHFLITDFIIDTIIVFIYEFMYDINKFCFVIIQTIFICKERNSQYVSKRFYDRRWANT